MYSVIVCILQLVLRDFYFPFFLSVTTEVIFRTS